MFIVRCVKLHNDSVVIVVRRKSYRRLIVLKLARFKVEAWYIFPLESSCASFFLDHDGVVDQKQIKFPCDEHRFIVSGQDLISFFGLFLHLKDDSDSIPV